AGLAIVSYFLLLAWQEDYPRVTESNGTPAQTQTSDVAPLSDVPAVSSAPAPGVAASDVPTLPTQPSASSAPAGLVEVHTDVLNVTLDLAGGDIVAVTLPQYKTHIDAENDPLVLLENNGG